MLCDPAIPFWVYIKGIEMRISKKYLHSHMYCSITIAKTKKRHKCPLTDEWIKEMWCIWNIIQPFREGHLAICDNRDEPEDIMLNKIN